MSAEGPRMVADSNDCSPVRRPRVEISVRDGKLTHLSRGEVTPCHLRIAPDKIEVGCTDITNEALEMILDAIGEAKK